MRIVDPNPQKSVAKQTACKHCGILLEYVPNDVTQTFHTDYSGSTDAWWYIRCPSCRGVTEVGRP
jgi:hypothetical protein